jgi:hypothetical protein
MPTREGHSAGRGGTVPRKTAADRVASSAKYHREQITRAKELARENPDEISAPMEAAVRWLYAALAQAAKANPDKAAERYNHAADQIAIYAESVQSRTADRK